MPQILLIGLFVLIAFPVGAVTYFYTLTTAQNTPVKNNRVAILAAEQHDVTITAAGQNFTLTKAQITSWVEPYTRTYNNQPDLRFSNALNDYVTTIATAVDQDPVDAKFSLDASGKAQIFSPSVAGQELNVASASAQLIQALISGKTQITLNVVTTQPLITLDSINQLGITGKIAEGESNFVGSTAARIVNIKVSAAKFNGLILNPGENFSFDDILGPVDASGGYALEKVIDGNKIEYQYGGGICQVSTTMFRAAIYAGFPITERIPHAFPVEYYNPQGFDATIYPGSADLKFVNNSPGHVLIETRIVGTKLYFDFYGTDDGRKVTVDGPYEYDVQADGAMKAYFTRTINLTNGSSTSQTFTSVYQSPKLFTTVANPYD